MSCSAKKSKKNLDSTHVGPTFWEQWGRSLPLHFNTFSHFSWLFCALKWMGYLSHQRSIYVQGRLDLMAACLCQWVMHMQPAHAGCSTLPHCPPWTLGRWERNLQCSFCAVAIHLLFLCKTHVVMFWKEEQEKTKFAFQVLLLITAFYIHPVRCFYRTSQFLVA
jgi:hypothetical protein